MGNKKRNSGLGRKLASTPATRTMSDEKHKARTLGLKEQTYVLGKPDSAASFSIVPEELSTYFTGHVSKNGAVRYWDHFGYWEYFNIPRFLDLTESSFTNHLSSFL